MKRNNMTSMLSYHPVIVDNAVSYLDANSQLDVDLGLPDDIATCIELTLLKLRLILRLLWMIYLKIQMQPG